jgi:hypothetical protein
LPHAEPVAYYSFAAHAVACGATLARAGRDGHVIKPLKLGEVAASDPDGKEVT